jgi:hypothetical protein
MFENEHVLLVNTPWWHLQQLLRNWSQQRPSNKGDLDTSVKTDAGIVYYTAVDLLLISFLYCST